MLGWAYGSDLLRPREPAFLISSLMTDENRMQGYLRVDEGGGLKESRLLAGFEGPKLGIRDGGANSTLMDGGAI